VGVWGGGGYSSKHVQPGASVGFHFTSYGTMCSLSGWGVPVGCVLGALKCMLLVEENTTHNTASRRMFDPPTIVSVVPCCSPNVPGRCDLQQCGHHRVTYLCQLTTPSLAPRPPNPRLFSNTKNRAV
jgi:hypothetical protein